MWRSDTNCLTGSCRSHQEALLYRDNHWKIHQLTSHRDGRRQKSSTNHMQHFLLFVVICFVLFRILVVHLTEHRAWQATTHILSPSCKIVTVKLENCKEKDQVHNCPVKALLNTAQEYRSSLGPYLGFTENGAELGYSGVHKDKVHSSSHLHPMAASKHTSWHTFCLCTSHLCVIAHILCCWSSQPCSLSRNQVTCFLTWITASSTTGSYPPLGKWGLWVNVSPYKDRKGYWYIHLSSLHLSRIGSQLNKCLLHKQENLNSDRQHPCRKPDMEVCTSKPSSVEAKVEVSLEFWGQLVSINQWATG